MSTHVVICGAGFGGLELTARLSHTFGRGVKITLIDKSPTFMFGFSKFEIMLGRQDVGALTSPYSAISKPGVEFRQELITSIDPETRRVVTDKATYDADILVVALGADYDHGATPGFVEGGQEFYSIEGALRLRDALPTFSSGKVLISILGEPFKCPPAPAEAAFLLDEYFSEKGVRGDIDIKVVSPWERPIPPSPGATEAILTRFRERGIEWVPQQKTVAIDPSTKTAKLRDGGEMAYDLFLGIPVHRVPDVVEASGLAVDGWIPVDKANLSTRFPGVYAIGDVTSAPVPKAGLFAEGAARAVAEHLIVELRKSGTAKPYDGSGACYIEFGEQQVGRVDVDFLSGPSVTGPFADPSFEIAGEKEDFATSRRSFWFGI